MQGHMHEMETVIKLQSILLAVSILEIQIIQMH